MFVGVKNKFHKAMYFLPSCNAQYKTFVGEKNEFYNVRICRRKTMNSTT